MMKIKFKNVENQSLVVNINEDELVCQVITKLRKQSLVEYEDIILLFKNVRLDINKRITQYNIGPEDFVLVLRYRFVLNRTEYYYLNEHYHQRVEQFGYDLETELRNLGALAARTIFEFCCEYAAWGISASWNGIMNIFKITGEASIECRCSTGRYPNFKLAIDKDRNFKYFLDCLSKKINIPSSNIKLFSDKYLKCKIKNKSIEEILKLNGIVYYQIVYSVDNIIKLEYLGKGAFGCVHKCVEFGSLTEFALKEFWIPKIKTESLNREIDILSKIDNHPRIVKMIRKIETENHLYILMEYAPNGSLGKYCRTKGPLNEVKISKFSFQILEALKYLHQKKIIHRDIKGDNILMFENESIKLCDFGLSKILTDIASQDLLNGVAQSTVGTANWMAPEIICDGKYGISADIWSFGATVIEMMTGKPPYYELETYQVIFKLGQDRKIEYKEPYKLSPQMKTFINCCLRANPASRSSASELLKHEFVENFHFDG